MAEIYTGDLLFGTHDNVEHLALMEKVTGNQFDESLCGRVAKSFSIPDENGIKGDIEALICTGYSKPHGSMLFKANTSLLSGTSRDYVEERSSLNKLFSLVRAVEDSDADLNAYIDICKGCLMFSPKLRMTASAACRYFRSKFCRNALGMMRFYTEEDAWIGAERGNNIGDSNN